MRIIHLCLVLPWLWLVSSGALADVFEIGGDGSMAIRASDPITGTPASAPPWPDLPARAVTIITSPKVPAPFQASIEQAAARAQVSPALLAALVSQESGWRPTAVSRTGARGLTQLMPGTARALAVDPTNVSANLVGGARYLRTLITLFDGNIERALAAYNAGPSRVLHSSGLPAIAATRAYVSSILDRLSLGNDTALGGAMR